MKLPGIQRWIRRSFTLSDQFLMVSFAILLTGMLVIGWWVAERIEHTVIDQTANVTTLYMNSFVSPLLQTLRVTSRLNRDQHNALQRLVTSTPLGKNIVTLRVWSPDGMVLFSLNAAQIDVRFPIEADLRQALDGKIFSRLAELDPDNRMMDHAFSIPVVETFVPVYADDTSRIIAVTEFHVSAADLTAQIAAAQQQSWLVVGLATMSMYLMLSGLFARGSRLIAQQQAELQQNVDRLSVLLKENENLRLRLQTAASRSSEINEQFLTRIGRDLHDGPAQDLAFALLRIDEIAQNDPTRGESIRTALQSALREIRGLAAGLQLPGLESLPTAEVARRAVRDFQRKTGATVGLQIADSLPSVSNSKKIAIYRVIGEALSNAMRHAQGKDMAVHLRANTDHILLEVCDGGPGFDPGNLVFNGEHLGLAGLQQRVVLLSGSFEIKPMGGAGTCVSVMLPIEEEKHE